MHYFGPNYHQNRKNKAFETLKLFVMALNISERNILYFYMFINRTKSNHNKLNF